MAFKPKAAKPKPYYEARELIAELYGIGPDYEPPPYLGEAVAFQAAVDGQED
jgi:hypothetical protein